MTCGRCSATRRGRGRRGLGCRGGAGAGSSARTCSAGTSAICRTSVAVAQRPRDLDALSATSSTSRAASISSSSRRAPRAVALHRAGVRRLLLKALPQQAALDPRPHAGRVARLVSRAITASATARRSSTICCRRARSRRSSSSRRYARASEFAARLERGRARLVPEADALRVAPRRAVAAAAHAAARARGREQQRGACGRARRARGAARRSSSARAC